MALETVYIDSSIAMTAVAEVFLAGDARGIGCIADMAVDAFNQAVLPGADAFMHGLVALVQDVLHVIGTHVSGRFYATLGLTEPCLGLGYPGQQGVSCLARRNHAEQHTEHQNYETVLDHGWSLSLV